MFGLSSSAGVFSNIADMLVAIYERAEFGIIKKWVDNFFAIRLPHQTWTEDDFTALTGAIRVPWSKKKTHHFAVTQQYIGFNWNLDQQTVALPLDKFQSIRSLVRSWLSKDATFIAHNTASLHGKLAGVGHCKHGRHESDSVDLLVKFAT